MQLQFQQPLGHPPLYDACIASTDSIPKLCFARHSSRVVSRHLGTPLEQVILGPLARKV